jgi:hypothetical protein
VAQRDRASQTNCLRLAARQVRPKLLKTDGRSRPAPDKGVPDPALS